MEPVSDGTGFFCFGHSSMGVNVRRDAMPSELGLWLRRASQRSDLFNLRVFANKKVVPPTPRARYVIAMCEDAGI